MMKIYFLDIKKEWEEFLREKIKREFVEDLEKAEILICRAKFTRINKDFLDKMFKLKMITTMSSGFDHIDLEECKKRGIVVCNVPCYCENSVAEHVFALILSLLKKIFIGKNIKTSELHGKVLGVIGGGRIGLRVIEIGKAFGMKPICYDIFKDVGASEKLGFEYVELDKLLKDSDVISLHTPLNKKTYHLINDEKIEIMKSGVIFINCSRGEVVDSLALIKGLEKEKIKGAGLDVWEGDDNMFLGRKNVIITFHNAANTREAEEKVLNETVENVLSFIKGKERNIVKRSFF